MRQNSSDIHKLVVVPDSHNEPIPVPAYIEHGQCPAAVNRNAVCVRIIPSNILQTRPLGKPCGFVPLPQRSLRIRKTLPELAQEPQADHPHLDILSNYRPRVKPLFRHFV